MKLQTAANQKMIVVRTPCAQFRLRVVYRVRIATLANITFITFPHSKVNSVMFYVISDDDSDSRWKLSITMANIWLPYSIVFAFPKEDAATVAVAVLAACENTIYYLQIN